MEIKTEKYMTSMGQFVAAVELRNEEEGKAYGITIDVNIRDLIFGVEAVEMYVSIFRRKAVEMGCSLTTEQVEQIRELIRSMIDAGIEEE